MGERPRGSKGSLELRWCLSILITTARIDSLCAWGMGLGTIVGRDCCYAWDEESQDEQDVDVWFLIQGRPWELGARL